MPRWLVLLVLAACHAAPRPDPIDVTIRTAWSQPVEPFKIVGNIYYVGGVNVASYLIATSAGLILVDSGPRELAPVITEGIAKLGFRIADVKLIVTSHAHWDHVEGVAALQRSTGAAVIALAEEAPALSSGVDRSALAGPGWEPIAIARVVHDGEDVVLGDVTLRAVWTPGHTQGATTWTTRVRDGDRDYTVAILGGLAANAGVKLIGNPRHPTIADDLARTDRVLRALAPDIYLMGHPQELFAGKLARVRAGDPSALVDPAAYRALLDEVAEDTRTRVAAER